MTLLCDFTIAKFAQATETFISGVQVHAMFYFAPIFCVKICGYFCNVLQPDAVRRFLCVKICGYFCDVLQPVAVCRFFCEELCGFLQCAAT